MPRHRRRNLLKRSQKARRPGDRREPRGHLGSTENAKARTRRALSEAATFSGGTFPLLPISSILGRNSCAVNTLFLRTHAADTPASPASDDDGRAMRTCVG